MFDLRNAMTWLKARYHTAIRRSLWVMYVVGGITGVKAL